MFKWIGRAVAGLFLDKQAREALARRQRARRRRPAADEREAHIAAIRENMRDVATPERQELLRRAMEVRRAKQKILADLSDEERQKLVALAMKKLLHEGKE